MNDLFYKFENDVMTAIIKKESGISKNLYAQYIHSNVVSREFTGYGFYTTYAVNQKYKIKTIKNAMLGDINASINDLKHGAGFILYINNGLIDVLECYTYDENFPLNVTRYELF